MVVRSRLTRRAGVGGIGVVLLTKLSSGGGCGDGGHGENESLLQLPLRLDHGRRDVLGRIGRFGGLGVEAQVRTAR